MIRKMFAGSTSEPIPIFVTNSSTGAGLGSLVFNTSNLACEYRRKGSSSWTTVTLSAGTLGTWSSGGFIADGSLTGAYELGLPNAALASGVEWVVVRLYGAANMSPCLMFIELDSVNYQDPSLGFLSQTLSSPRALDAIADTSLTWNDALQCAIAGAVGKKDASSGTTYIVSTPSTGTVLRTYTLTLIDPPSTVPDRAV